MVGNVAPVRGLALTGLASGLLWAGAAAATPLSGTSSATFDTLTSCSGDTCTNSPNNVVTWYKTSDGASTESTLTAVDLFPFTASADATIDVAELTWDAGSTTATPDFDYHLTLHITSPNAATDGPTTLDLTTSNGTGKQLLKGLNVPDLAGLDITFADGATLSDFQYVLATGSGNGSLTTPNSGKDVWTVPDNTPDAVLYITADFNVPEPESLALFGAALLGFAFLGRRKRGNVTPN
jgi:hypothetical protein